MRKEWEKEYRETMDGLTFTPQRKEAMRERLERALTDEEREERNMKKITWKKAAAIAAVACIVLGGTGYAAGKIVILESHSNGTYAYDTAEELNEKTRDELDAEGFAFPETLLAGTYRFASGDTVGTTGRDTDGNTVAEWDELTALYADDDGANIRLTATKNWIDADRQPTSTKEIAGVTVTYNYDEYLFLPPDDEGNLDPAIAEREETDAHFYVSYGSDEPETMYYQSASFEKDGIYLLLMTSSDVTADDLYAIAEELIGQ